MDARRTIVPRGAIAIKGHTIAAVGPQAEILRDWRATDVIDAKGAIVHPGCVDAHLHVNAQTCRGFFRGDASKGAARRSELRRLESDADARGRERRGGARRGRNASAWDHDVRRAGQRVRAGCGGGGDRTGRHPLHARRTVSLGHDGGHASDSGPREQDLVRPRSAGARPVPQIARQPASSQQGQGRHHARARCALRRGIGLRRALCRGQGDGRSSGRDPQQSYRLRS